VPFRLSSDTGPSRGTHSLEGPTSITGVQAARLKHYADEMPGVSSAGHVDRHPPINSQAHTNGSATRHRSRWPFSRAHRDRQLEPGDVVMDPFCGCGTAIVAAEKLGRTVDRHRRHAPRHQPHPGQAEAGLRPRERCRLRPRRHTQGPGGRQVPLQPGQRRPLPVPVLGHRPARGPGPRSRSERQGEEGRRHRDRREALLPHPRRRAPRDRRHQRQGRGQPEPGDDP
jgi:hypothetical protein